MPCLRHSSPVSSPASDSFSTPTICSSVYRFFFIRSPHRPATAGLHYGRTLTPCGLIGGRQLNRRSGDEDFRRDAPKRTPVLAAALLRFQRLHAAQTDREAPVHSSQPDSARSGRPARRLDVVELSALSDRRTRTGRDR